MDATEPTPGTLRADVWLVLYAAEDGLTEAELVAKLARGNARIQPRVWLDRLTELASEGAVRGTDTPRGRVWQARRRTAQAEALSPELAWWSVPELVAEAGYEASKQLVWGVGRKVADAWRAESGEAPRQEPRAKSDGTGTHYKAVYPPHFRATGLACLAEVVRQLVVSVSPALPEAPMAPPLPDIPDNRPTVLLVDGKNLLYRALMSKGAPVEQDFPRRLAELRTRYAPAFAILTWDADGPTWRHREWPDYKAGRGEPSPYERQVYAQVPGWAAMCGYQFVEAPGWEADDIIGTYTRQLRDAHRVVIVSNDKDLTQLLGPGVVLLKGWSDTVTHLDVAKPPTVKGDESAKGGWGVPPARIPDLLAIMGDSSDSIPGVPKIGVQGAVKLITEFGGVEDIIAAAKSGKDKAKGRAERIVAHADALRLFLRLTTISTGINGLPAPVPCAAMPPQAAGPRAELPGMTVLDGVLYPLPETSHMAASLGWRWTNPTKATDRAQAQLRPGEPMERWEREDHWGYLVERGPQWTFVCRVLADDIETGAADLGPAMTEAEVWLRAALNIAGTPNAPWKPTDPQRPLPSMDAVTEARKAVEWERARNLAATDPAALGLPRPGVEVRPPEGAVVLGGIEGQDGQPVNAFGELGGPLASPTVPDPVATLTAAADLAQRAVTIVTAPVVQPPVIKGPPWAIPTDPTPGKETIPLGYARVVAALTIEAFAGAPVSLVWDVDLKTDIAVPPLEGAPLPVQGQTMAFRAKAMDTLVKRLHGALQGHKDDPGATMPLRVVATEPEVPQATPSRAVLIELPHANISRIANGPPPAGRWVFRLTRDLDTFTSVGPSYFDNSDLPF